jgi:hypothetical protein
MTLTGERHARTAADGRMQSTMAIPAARHTQVRASGATLRALLLALVVGAAHQADARGVAEPAGAASNPQAAPPQAKREGRARLFDPEDGAVDLSYFLENPRGFIPIPLVVTEPAVGYGGGAV